MRAGHARLLAGVCVAQVLVLGCTNEYESFRFPRGGQGGAAVGIADAGGGDEADGVAPADAGSGDSGVD